MINVKYDKSTATIFLSTVFIDYDFGPRGEHGILEWGEFYYTTDGKKYNKLLRCEVTDQEYQSFSTVLFRNKLRDAIISIMGFYKPGSRTLWSANWGDQEKLYMYLPNYSQSSSFGIDWIVPSDLNIKRILFIGKWYVDGLNCSKEIVGEVYPIQSDVP